MQTETVLARAKRTGNIYFGVGWFLTLVNIGAVAWSIWFYFDLSTRPERLGMLFFVDEQAASARLSLIGIAVLAVLALLQIMFLDRIAGGLKQDIEETVAAEAAMKLAKYTAYAALAVCLVSIIVNVRTYRAWMEYIRNFR